MCLESWDSRPPPSAKKGEEALPLSKGHRTINSFLAWAKPGVMLVCATCDRLLVAEDEEEE